MKTLAAAIAIAASFGVAGPLSAQTVMQPSQTVMQPSMPPALAQQPMASALDVSPLAPWTQNDGSSSDHPIHNPGDISGNRLNREYENGIPVPPGMSPDTAIRGFRIQ
jgi:hypothetical protein